MKTKTEVKIPCPPFHCDCVNELKTINTELLEACKEALKYFDSIKGADRYGNYFSIVIAKAEGR